MKPTLTMSQSVLNRLLNFADELDAPTLPALQGAQIDQALAAPTAPMPAEPELAGAVVSDSLGLEPR